MASKKKATKTIRKFPNSINVYWGDGARDDDDYLLVEENGLDALIGNVENSCEVAVYELKFVGKLETKPTLTPIK